MNITPANCAQDSENNYSDYYVYLISIRDSSRTIQLLKNFLANNPDNSLVYQQIFQQLTFRNDLRHAFTYFDSLANTSEYSKNSLWMLAKIYDLLGNHVQAYDCYKKIFESGKANTSLIRDFVNFLYRNERTYDQLAEIKKIIKKRSDQSIARAFYNLRNAHFKEAIRRFQQIDSRSQQNSVLIQSLGYCYYKLGEYQKAKTNWQTCLKTAENSHHIGDEIRALVGLSFINKRDPATYSVALDYNQTALAKARQIDNLALMQYAQGSLGILFLDQGDYEHALSLLREAVVIGEKIGEYKNAAHFYMALAQCSRNQKKYQNSLIAYQKSEQLARLANDKDLAIILNRERGTLYRTIGLMNLARESYKKTYETIKSNPFENYNYRSIYHYANILMEAGNVDEARDLYLQVINFPENKIAKIDRAYCLFRLGELSADRQLFDQSEQYFLKAAAICRSYGDWDYAKKLLANSRLRIANLELKKNNLEAAFKICDEPVIAAAGEIDNNIKIEKHLLLGKSFDKKKEPYKALQNYLSAFNIAENQRTEINVDQFRIGYLGKNIEIYQLLIKSYLKQFFATHSDSSLKKLFYFMEISQARALQDLIGIKNVRKRSTQNGKIYKDYLTTGLELETLQRRIRENPSNADDYAVSLSAKRFDLLNDRLQLFEEDVQQSDKMVISLEDALNRLTEMNTGLLFYHISDEAAFVFAVCREDVKVVELPVTPRTLEAAIDSLLTPFFHVENSSIANVPFRAAISYRLYQYLIEPVETYLDLSKNLLIVPDQALSGLPFEMLLTEPPDSSEYTPEQPDNYSENFLLHRYAILYSPFTWLKLGDENTGSKGRRILIFANPTTSIPKTQSVFTAQTFRSGWNFDVLPFAEEEAENIQQIYDDVTLFKRDKATEKAFLKSLPDYNILHLATHAFIDSVFDPYSGLLLTATEDSSDDGLLMGYEISDLDLTNYDLITLSACETGRGQKMQGEGLLGLPRIFLGSGAKQVVMTSWKITDRFSALLMKRFYDNFLNKDMPKSEALWQAKRSLLSVKNNGDDFTYQHPLFWAAYSIYGRPEIVDDAFDFFKTGIFVLSFFLIAGIGFFFFRKKRAVTRPQA